MCGQPTAYNTYATLPYTNPLFMGFSCSQNVNKEIIQENIKSTSRVHYTPELRFWGVFYGKRQIMRQSLNSTPPVMGGAASGICPEDYLTMA